MVTGSDVIHCPVIFLLPLAVDAVEYCHNQVFTASCDIGSVIAIESAFYGRLRLGSCVKTDFGYIGCYRLLYL